MINNILNLTENYTTQKYTFQKEEITINPDKVEVPVVMENNLSEYKRKQLRMNCSMLVPIGAMMLTGTTSFGLFEQIKPFLLPIVFDVGKIIFYTNGAKAVYKMCNGDAKGAIAKFKDVSMGYALLIGLDGIMYFIESYVGTIADGLAKAGAVGMVMLG